MAIPDPDSQLFDAAVKHAVDLTKYSNGAVRQMVALLNRSDAKLVDAVAKALERLPPESFTVKRLEAQLSSMRSLNSQAYQALGKQMAAEMQDLTAYEIGYQQSLFKGLDLVLTSTHVSAQTVYTAAFARPFQGRLLSEWIDGLESAAAARVRDAVRQGYVQGLTIDQIVRSIRGTRAKRYADGVLEIGRRDAEAVVRTAVGHFAAFSRDAWYDAQSDLIGAVQWVSTLDTHTTPQCRIRDGLRYTPDHKPIGHHVPWLAGPGELHWGCRSTSIPILKGDEDETLSGSRASMSGPVAAKLTFGAWLKTQNAATQDDILGPTRGAMFRKGDLSLSTFYNDKGQYLTLAELRAKLQ